MQASFNTKTQAQAKQLDGNCARTWEQQPYVLQDVLGAALYTFLQLWRFLTRIRLLLSPIQLSLYDAQLLRHCCASAITPGGFI